MSLPSVPDIQGVRRTIALTFLLLSTLFALSSFHMDYRRLVQSPSFQPPQMGNSAALLHKYLKLLRGKDRQLKALID
jgi:hypothetical protein